jgi:sulfopyruvate decarboxylase subunit alpha
MNSEDFCQLLKQHGFNLFVGVPCSTLKGILNHLMHDPEVMYVPATREDEAIGIAVGAHFGGRKPIVFMQNAGLGLSINAIASLVQLYRIPLLFLISWRGDTNQDAPEHHFMGSHTVKLLDAMEIPTFILSKKNVKKTLLKVCNVSESGNGPTALLLREAIIE